MSKVLDEFQGYADLCHAGRDIVAPLIEGFNQRKATQSHKRDIELVLELLERVGGDCLARVERIKEGNEND